MSRRSERRMSGRGRLVLAVFGIVLICVGLVFAAQVNIVSIYWGGVELFSGVVGTIITMIGGACVVKAAFKG